MMIVMIVVMMIMRSPSQMLMMCLMLPQSTGLFCHYISGVPLILWTWSHALILKNGSLQILRSKESTEVLRQSALHCGTRPVGQPWPPRQWGKCSPKSPVPCTTRWNSFHDAVASITEIHLNDLTTICDRLGLKCFSDRELQFLKEYCAITKPLTVALDILQGEDNCYYGTLLPTLEVLMAKTLEKKEGLTVAMGLPDAIVQVRNIPSTHGNVCIFYQRHSM